MKREFLEGLGLEKDVIDQIMAENGKDINREKNRADNVQTQLDEAKNALKGFEGVNVEELSGKVTTAEQQVAALQAELAAEKTAAAVRLGLIQAKALDVDYLTYKLTEKLKADGKTAEIDESGKVKDWDALLDGLQKQFPTQFEGSGSRKIEEHKLPDSDKDAHAEPATLADALRDYYEPKND